jgi:hypothetical protein
MNKKINSLLFLSLLIIVFLAFIFIKFIIYNNKTLTDNQSTKYSIKSENIYDKISFKTSELVGYKIGELFDKKELGYLKKIFTNEIDFKFYIDNISAIGRVISLKNNSNPKEYHIYLNEKREQITKDKFDYNVKELEEQFKKEYGYEEAFLKVYNATNAASDQKYYDNYRDITNKIGRKISEYCQKYIVKKAEFKYETIYTFENGLQAKLSIAQAGEHYKPESIILLNKKRGDEK